MGREKLSTLDTTNGIDQMASIDDMGHILCGETTDELRAFLMDSLEEFVLRHDVGISSARIDALRALLGIWEGIVLDDRECEDWIKEFAVDNGLLIQPFHGHVTSAASPPMESEEGWIHLPEDLMSTLLTDVLNQSLASRYCKTDAVLELLNGWKQLAVVEERLAGHLVKSHQIFDPAVLESDHRTLFDFHTTLHEGMRGSSPIRQ